MKIFILMATLPLSLYSQCTKCDLIERKMTYEIDRLSSKLYQYDIDDCRHFDYQYLKGRLDALEDLRIYYLTD